MLIGNGKEFGKYTKLKRVQEWDRMGKPRR